MAVMRECETLELAKHCGWRVCRDGAGDGQKADADRQARRRGSSQGGSGNGQGRKEGGRHGWERAGCSSRDGKAIQKQAAAAARRDLSYVAGMTLGFFTAREGYPNSGKEGGREPARRERI